MCSRPDHTRGPEDNLKGSMWASEGTISKVRISMLRMSRWNPFQKRILSSDILYRCHPEHQQHSGSCFLSVRRSTFDLHGCDRWKMSSVTHRVSGHGIQVENTFLYKKLNQFTQEFFYTKSFFIQNLHKLV